MHCTASPNLILDNRHRIPKDEGSSYSKEGNKAHAAAAAGLLMGDEALVEACEGDAEMVKHTRNYIKFVKDKKKSDDEEFVETEVPIWFYKGKRGFIDHSLLNSKRLYITDLKYGEGQYVAARGNTQGAIYAMSLIVTLRDICDFPPDFLITICIYQPRCRQGKNGKPYSIWSLTVEELYIFVKRISDTAEGIKSRKLYEFAPNDDNCRYCKALPFCKARAKQLLGDGDEILPDKPQPLAEAYLDEPATLDPDTLSFLVRNKNTIKTWLDKLAKYAYASVKDGKPEAVNYHWKLVEGRLSDRFYKDPKKAGRFLMKHIPKEEVYPEPEVMSPAQAEKKLASLFGKAIAEELLADYTDRKPGGEVLAPIEDEREALAEDTAENHFGDLADHDLL